LLIILLCSTACLTNPVPQENPPKVNCGSPAIEPDTSTNIIGGKAAIPYSWPWSAALCVKQGNQCNLRCGGSLISNQWIMTAGHCFQKTESPTKFAFKLGVFDQTKQNEDGELVLDITEFHIHPKYNGGGGTNPPTYDITLVKLKDPVQFNDHISPVCLPSKQNEELPPAETTAFLTGWGRIKNSNSAPANPTLQQVAVPVVSREKCKKIPLE